MKDVVIIGGGPAGMMCAATLGKYGIDTLILDENEKIGGQLVKQTHKFFGDHAHYASVRGFEIADKLQNEISASKSIKVETEATVLGIYPGNVVLYTKNDEERKVKANKILIATGAMEKQLPFVNSDLPGIYGAGAIQTLMNEYGVMPGKRFLIVGSGNIGLILAYQLIQAGAEVKAIVEALDKVGGYQVHADKVKRLGVPILLRHTIVKAIGDESVQGAVISEIDEKFGKIPGTQREMVVDTIAIAVGLTPLTELAEQAGCEVRYIPELGGYVPIRNERMRTTNPNVFIAGDLSSIEEATTAMIEGKIAALEMAHDVANANVEKEIIDELKTLALFRSGPKSEKIRTGLEKMGVKMPEVFSPVKNEEKPDVIGKLRAVLECYEEIPCNSCEASCPFGAIYIGENLNSTPVLDAAKCTGCGKCVNACPGLAVFLVKEEKDGKNALVGIPYELLPLPEKGEIMWALDREGNYVCNATVERVVKYPNKTNIVFAKIPVEFKEKVRHFSFPKKESPLVCRCEEVTLEEIEKVIDSGITDFEEIKRLTRVSMGPCGGKNCKLVVLGVLSRKTGIPISELSHGTSRPPVKPVEFSVFAKDGEKR